MLGEDGVRLDLDRPPRVDERGDHHHRRGGPHVPERVRMRAADGVGHLGGRDVHAGADHVVEAGAGFGERGGDDLEAAARLLLGIRVTAAVGPHRPGPGHVNVVADAEGAAEPDRGLVRRSRRNTLPLRAAVDLLLHGFYAPVLET
ncbi:MAG TPA: hypothetical protein VK906_01600 [Egicoccus sp.]|nr:hypothetical protein [Egicoccus sp.]HSK21835.1 hypothetical protein [Egicoccus sp.]